MTTPTEHKTVHPPSPTGLRRTRARILEYAEAEGRDIGNWRLEIGKGSLFFEDLLNAKVREFNPRYAEAEGALPGKFRHLHTDIYGHPPSPRLRRTGRV